MAYILKCIAKYSNLKIYPGLMFSNKTKKVKNKLKTTTKVSFIKISRAEYPQSQARIHTVQLPHFQILIFQIDTAGTS